MTSMNVNLGSKKRHLPSEMMHRFSCKDDFLQYFTIQCKSLTSDNESVLVQLYTPDKLMVNKDFLR